MAVTFLSVNVNKIAVLRNSRGGQEPDLLRAATTCLDAGADGITVHPRPDGRHIRASDIGPLAALCKARGVEFNIEGNPFAPARAGYPGLLALCDAARPAQVTFVPDTDGQLTSDHGFDFADAATLTALEPLITAYRAIGCRVSLFADATSPCIARAADVGAQRVELYTGPYAHAQAEGNAHSQLAECAAAAQRAQAAGLGVNAGHDLSQTNLENFLTHVPHVLEVSIGHALIAEALYAGLATTVAAYKALTTAASTG